MIFEATASQRPINYIYATFLECGHCLTPEKLRTMQLLRQLSIVSLAVVLLSQHTAAFLLPKRLCIKNTEYKQKFLGKLMMISPALRDFVKVDLSVLNDGIPVDTPFDQGLCSFVVGGGRFFPELNEMAEKSPVGELVKFSAKLAEFNPEMTADIPLANAPGGLRIGDIVKMSNGMSVRVAEITNDIVRIDANPPLAGKTLEFLLKVLERKPNSSLTQATFAAGCFWGLELAFQRVRGVAYTAVGYTHGVVEDPSYEAVCSGETGHAEAVTVLYDPAEVSYDELLEVFWARHDPTQLNGQGNDIGTQYRGGIYFHNELQKSVAETSMATLQTSLGKPLATELLPSTKFWLSEDYHQQYLEKGGQSAKKTAVEKIRCYG